MAKFCGSRRLRFEDTKRIMSPEIRPKSFGTFEKQAPVPSNETDEMKNKMLYKRHSFINLCLELFLRTVHTNYRYFSPVCDYAGNVDLNNSY